MSGILFLADLHAGMSTHDGPDADGTPSWRANECRRVVRAAVEIANEQRAHIVMPGDTFHVRKPPAWAYLAVGEELARADLEVYAIPGNHDGTTNGIPSPLGVLAAYGVNIITRPVTLEIGGYDVLMLPWAGRSFIEAADPKASVADQHRMMGEAVQRLVGAFAVSTTPARKLVVTHATIAGAAYNSGTQPQLGDSSEFMIPLPAIAHPMLEAVVSGHVHKPQMLEAGGSPVYYVGSPVRHDFGEEEQTCRALHLDGDGFVAEWEMPATEFVTFGVEEDIPQREVVGSVVRLKGELPAGPETAAIIAARHKRLEDAGALRIGKPAITYVRHDAPKRSALTTDMTPTQALERYIDEVGGEFADRRDELLVLHEEVAHAEA